MDEKSETKIPVTVLFPVETLERVDELAKQENRPRGGQVRQLVNEALDARKKEP